MLLTAHLIANNDYKKIIYLQKMRFYMFKHYVTMQNLSNQQEQYQHEFVKKITNQ